MEKFIIITVLVVLIIYVNRIKQRKANDEIREDLITNINTFNWEIEVLRNDYFTYKNRDKVKMKYKTLYDDCIRSNLNNVGIIREFVNTYRKFDELVKEWNEEYIRTELDKNKKLFNDIDGKSLDNQQRKAVVVDEMNNLILAGAGSGKTLTISAKVKYLVDRKNIDPKDILLISFTRKSANEMSERITKGLNINIEAQTFHKVGLDIITKNRRKRPDVAEENTLSKIVYSYFNKNIFKDKKQMRLLVTFFGYYLYIPKDLSEFKNLGERNDFYRSLDFETIKSKANKDKVIEDELERQRSIKQTIQGETVKSLEELMIANFLYLNGIDYVYEYKYPFDLKDNYRKYYRPDFYLTEYDIYLEHFGITEDFRVPWLSEIEEKKYLEGIVWKRNIHRENETKLLETYSYYNRRGILLAELETKLKKEGVKFGKVNTDEIYKRILENKEKNYFKESSKLFETFIQLFKSNGYSIKQFEKLKVEVSKNDNVFLRERATLFLDIIKPAYIEYENFLKQNELIDFNDMINMARGIVEEDNLMFNYKYIIIDEYQDISMSRFRLIKSIRDRTDAKIMCVGDDWQSIYRFTGSDIDLFTSFKQYFGYCEILKIENTYRNSQELINIAGKFVMENPYQLKKNLKSTKRHSNPLRIITYDERPSLAIKKAIEEIVNHFGFDSQIIILGRNNFDIDRIENDLEDKQKEFKIIEKGNDKTVVYKRYPNLKIDYLTVHRSKGLEGNNVIVINLENNSYGFPNRVADDPILSLVLTKLDSFEFAEERRLFYVALTRTKNTTYLVAPVYMKSIFCEELVEKFNMKCEPSDHMNNITMNPNCPRCQKGFLVVRKNDRDREFLGCSNYPYCDYTVNNLEILDNQIRCSSCGGYMVKRSGPYSDFYGCTNFPLCNNKLNIEATFKVNDDYLKFNKKDYDFGRKKIDDEKHRDDFKKIKVDDLKDQGKINFDKEVIFDKESGEITDFIGFVKDATKQIDKEKILRKGTDAVNDVINFGKDTLNQVDKDKIIDKGTDVINDFRGFGKDIVKQADEKLKIKNVEDNLKKIKNITKDLVSNVVAD